MKVSQILEHFERTALEALRDDPDTSHRLRESITRCYSYRWDSLTELIEMTVKTTRDMKRLLGSRYPHLLRIFNDLLPPPFRFDLGTYRESPTLAAMINFVQAVKDRFENNQPERYRFFLDQCLIMRNMRIREGYHSPALWKAVTMVFIALWSEEDLLGVFCRTIS